MSVKRDLEMISTKKSRIATLLLVMVTVFTALFIPINAAETETSEDIGIEEITPKAANSAFNWTYSHHYIHKENDTSREIHSVFSPDAYDALETLDKANANISYPSGDGGMIYVFEYSNAGYQGGFAGTGQTLNHIRVVVNYCGNVITAYPV